jgi:hypothetical protein
VKETVLRIKVIFMSMITFISLLFFGFGYDEPEAFSPNEYLVSTVDSIKVADSISVKLMETGEYSRDDFNLLLEKFCTDKPISPEELIENRPVLK